MSSFLSTKYLKYRELLRSGTSTIDRDVFCHSCGYNVRGLIPGRNCPECGLPIPLDMLQSTWLLSGDYSIRRKTAAALAILVIALLVAAATRLALFLTLVFDPLSVLVLIYVVLQLCACLAWTAAVWWLTSSKQKLRNAGLARVRTVIRLSQILWPAAYICIVLRITNAIPAMDQWFTTCWFVFRVIAAVGAVGFILTLLHGAAEAELEDAYRRIHLSMWVLPLPTVLLAILPLWVPWIFLFLIAMILLTWCWFMVWLALGALEMQRYITWSLRMAEVYHERAGRMAETRRELEQQAESIIRPVQPPADSPDIDISAIDDANENDGTSKTE